MKSVLFLDFDGVINNTGYDLSAACRRRLEEDKRAGVRKRRVGHWALSPTNIERLRDVMRALPDLEVVVSSSWRIGTPLEDLRELLAEAVPPARVIGVTPRLESRLRYQEVLAWVEANAPGARYLALDDDSFDMVQLRQRFMFINREYGLTRQHVRRIIAYFRRPEWLG